MHKMSAITLIICIVSIGIVMQGAAAQSCSTCTSTYTTEFRQAGDNQDKLCSAANKYRKCADKDCTSDSDFTIGLAKTAQHICGAGSILVNLTVIGLGLTLYMLV